MPTRTGPAAAARKPQIVDTTGALDRIGGDWKLLQELAAIFREDSPALLRSLRACVAEGNLSQAEHYAHGLKGSASNVGGVRVADVARVVEDAARAGQRELVDAGVQTLTAELERLLEALKSVSLADSEASS